MGGRGGTGLVLQAGGLRGRAAHPGRLCGTDPDRVSRARLATRAFRDAHLPPAHGRHGPGAVLEEPAPVRERSPAPHPAHLGSQGPLQSRFLLAPVALAPPRGGYSRAGHSRGWRPQRMHIYPEAEVRAAWGKVLATREQVARGVADWSEVAGHFTEDAIYIDPIWGRLVGAKAIATLMHDGMVGF